MRFAALTIAVFATTASAALAEGFQRIEDKDTFMSVIEDRDLKRLGIRLKVVEDGRIVGRAFGKDVTGKWQWDGGYFCRDLAVDGDPLEFNCQMVQIKGRTVRFTSDKGKGIYADLRLD